MLVVLAAAGAVPWRLIARAAPSAPPVAAADPTLAICKEQLHTIGQAIQSYRKEHGEPPPQLSDLSPRYVSDLKRFHCPADKTDGSSRLADDFSDETAPPADARPVSYAYHMSPKSPRVNFGRIGGPGSRGTDRSWRGQTMAQRKQYGDRVPIARCWHHARTQHQAYSRPLVLSLTLDGTVYQGRGNWQMEPEAIAVVVERMERDLDAGPAAFREQWSPGSVAHQFLHVAMEEDPAFQQERKRLVPGYVEPGQRLLPLRARLRALAARVEALAPSYPASVSESDRLAMVGALHDVAGDIEPAVTAYESVVARIKAGDPIHEIGGIAVRRRLPTLYSSRGQHEKAIAVHQRFLLKEPDDWMEHILIAREYEAMGQHEKALELRRKWDPSGQLRGKPAPEFMLNDASGRPVAMTKLPGRVVVLYFSHGAYPRFREVTRELDALQRKYGEQGLCVIALARGADRASAAAGVPQNHAYPLLLSADTIYARYGVRDSSMLYIIDRQGKVAHIYLGYGMDLGAERWLEAESRKLLDNKQTTRA